jgi:putative DNA primase/helicase
MSVNQLEEKQQEDAAIQSCNEATSPASSIQPNESPSTCATDLVVVKPQAEPTQVPPEPALKVLSVNADGVPASLKQFKNWVHWKEGLTKKGKPTKVPYIVDGTTCASSTNPATWKGCEEAINSLGSDRGLGFMLPGAATIFFIDLDKVRDPETGTIHSWALQLIAEVGSYTEISPFGTGVHILGRVKGAIPAEGKKVGSAEIYTNKRFATVTGNHFPSSPTDLEEADVSCLYRLIMARVFEFSEGDKYKGLFVDGAWEALDYQSQNEADMALCSLLAKRLNNHVDDIDCAFRLSALMRDKWDSKRGNSTYGRDTILKVLKEAQPGPELTDLGNAERLVAQHRGDMYYCFSTEEWLVWDGTRFEVDGSGAIDRIAKDTARSIRLEAMAKPEKQRSKFLQWAKHCQGRGAIAAMIHLATSEPGVSIQRERLDSDPWLFNCNNGTIDLRTGNLREHRREDLITKLAPVEFDPAAECPIWKKFLDRIMGGDMALIGFLQRAIGYSLTGLTTEHVIFIQYGQGRNGKTTFAETINCMMGDYAKTADASLLLTRRGDGPRSDIARLEGARLVFNSETPDDGKLNEALAKLLTGGDKIASRRLYREEREFYSTGKIWLRTNKKPMIRGRDNAIWDRIRLIPFTATIPDSEQDKTLREKLIAELPGILAWAVEGCLEWQKKGLCPPPAVLQATKEYEEESDVLKDFIEDCCSVHKNDKSFSATCDALYKAYHDYCTVNDYKDKDIEAPSIFGKLLTERGFGQEKRKGVRCRVGIVLKSATLPAPAPATSTKETDAASTTAGVPGTCEPASEPS